ncbi:MAG: cytochrome c family protein [Alphaproteobacteria bacterium]|nr:cytochrome c family protein [Alphaproteobacteria bacterium]
MDFFEWNKILGAILGSALVIFGVIRISGDELFAAPHLAEPAFKIAVAEEGGAGGGETKVAAVDTGTLLAAADAARGERIAQQCVSCHTFEKGGPAKQGPNLWNIVGRDKASEAGFGYSQAMKSQTGKWTYEELDHYLKDPRAAVPNNNMAFPGVKRDSQRADLLAYLGQQNDSPPPFPAPAPAATGG